MNILYQIDLVFWLTRNNLRNNTYRITKVRYDSNIIVKNTTEFEDLTNEEIGQLIFRN